jgi:hypothetical protein
MFLFLGPFPVSFGLSGVIVPKRPPCFAIPFFEEVWFPREPPTDHPRTVFIQDVCNPDVQSFVRFRLESMVKTISRTFFKTLSVESGEYDISNNDWDGFDIPMYLTGRQRFYAFAESLEVVRIGHREPLRQRLFQRTVLRDKGKKGASYAKFESEGDEFTLLELARFQQSREMCLDAVGSCFALLEQHNRALAVHWLEMTKDDLRSEGILESTD